MLWRTSCGLLVYGSGKFLGISGRLRTALVPHPARYGAQVEADSKPDQVGQQHRHDADRTVVRGTGHDLPGEQQGREHAEAGHAYRRDDAYGEERAPGDPAHQQDVGGPPVEGEGEDERGEVGGEPSRAGLFQLAQEKYWTVR